MINIILLLGFVWRLINLNQSLWLDEGITALAVKGNSLTELITKFSPGDFHPPLYYLILKLWTDIFGYSEIALRFPSIIFGLIAIVFVYFIGKKLFNKKVGFIAALFLAINPLAVYYSQEARMYSLAMMLVAGSMWFLLSKERFWFVVFAAASVYTDYLPWLMFPVYFFMLKDRKILLFPIFLYLPWLPSFLTQLQTGLALTAAIPAWSAILGGFSLKALALTYVKFIFGRISFDNKIVYGLLVAIAGGGYLAIASRTKNKTLWLWLLLPLFGGMLLSLKVSVFTYFRFLFVLPALPLLLAAGAKSKLAIIFVVAVSLSSLIWFNLRSEFWRENWRSAVEYVDSNPGLVIMPSLAQSAPLAYYNLKSPLEDINNINLQNFQNIYLLRYVPEIFDPQDVVLKTIESSGYKFKENINFNGVVIWRYEKI